MRYLSGVPYPAVMRWEHGGVMFTPEMGNTPDLAGVTWAADNGCYTAGERFSPERWLAWLDNNEQYWPSCLFAVLPDVPFDAAATWERGRQYIGELRSRGLRPALAIQEGIEHIGVPWSEIGAVFIAGRDHRFKQSQVCRRIVLAARGRDMPAHYARANSGKAIQAAFDMSCTSADGTFLRFAPDINWRRMQGWFERMCRHEQADTWGSDERFSTCRHCGRQLWQSVAR